MAVVRSGRCPALEYIRTQKASDQKKIWALLNLAARRGPPFNEQKFRKLEGEIFEFKAYQDRLQCFFEGEPRS